MGQDRLPEPSLPGDDAHQLDLGTGQVDGRGHDVEVGAVRARLDDLRERDVVNKDLIGADRALPVLHVERGGGVALRVEIDHQHPLTELRQRGGDVHRRRRLANPAFLVRDNKDPGRVGPGDRLALDALAQDHRVVSFGRERCLVVGESFGGCEVAGSANADPVSRETSGPSVSRETSSARGSYDGSVGSPDTGASCGKVCSDCGIQAQQGVGDRWKSGPGVALVGSSACDGSVNFTSSAATAGASRPENRRDPRNQQRYWRRIGPGDPRHPGLWNFVVTSSGAS